MKTIVSKLRNKEFQKELFYVIKLVWGVTELPRKKLYKMEKNE